MGEREEKLAAKAAQLREMAARAAAESAQPHAITEQKPEAEPSDADKTAKLRAIMAARKAQMQAENVAEEPQPELEEKPVQKPVITISLSGDKLWAEIELQRTGADTVNPTATDIYAKLDEMGIIYGIKSTLVEQLCERPVYNQKIEIARGKPAQVGADGHLEFLIETKKDLRPKLRPDGTVDYRDLGFIQNVEQGQQLCMVHPAEKGEDGCNLLGEAIEGIFGKEPKPPVGKNTEYDEEKRAVVAATPGNAEVVRGLINVHDVLKLATVDNSTGDIVFSGDIIVSGDIPSGFSVVSQSGNIAVKGTVEGATLTAVRGDILVGEGINGMNRGVFTAGGSIKCKFIQNCKLITGADIYADSIMYCDIECSGSVELSGKRGTLIGGNAVIARTLLAKTIGTDSHVATTITMAGVGVMHNEKIKELTKVVQKLDAELVSLIQTMTWCEDLSKKGKLKPFHVNAFEQAKARQPELMKERNAANKTLEQAKDELLTISPELCYIKCTGRVHSGVRIIFGPQVLQVTSSFVNSRISLMGDIQITPQ